MRTLRRRLPRRSIAAGWMGASLVFTMALPCVATSSPDEIVDPAHVANAVSVRGLKSSNALVSGKLVNLSSTPLRDVELMVQHTWLWKDERHPGKDNPGRTAYFRVAEELPPHGEIAFEYKPSPPLPERNDGSFETRVEVTGYAEAGK